MNEQRRPAVAFMSKIWQLWTNIDISGKNWLWFLIDILVLHHSISISLARTDCDSWSDMLWLVLRLKDRLLKNRITVFFDRWDLLLDLLLLLLLPLSFFERSSDSLLTNSSKCRLKVGYLDTDLVIPCNLHYKVQVMESDYEAYHSFKKEKYILVAFSPSG